MEKNHEDVVKYHQAKRKRHKIKLATITVVLFVISIILIGTYYYFDKEDVVTYKENSNVEYEVNIKENEFYDDSSIKDGMNTISILIKDIDAEFKYNLDLSEELKYKYDYKIVAEVEVKEKSKSNSIYEKQYEIIKKYIQETQNNKLEILEKINIDYNRYNDEIKRLIEVYSLKDTISEIRLVLYVNVVNQNTGKSINATNKVAQMTIPLTTNTVEITMNENVKGNQGETLKFGISKENLNYIFVFGFLMFVSSLLTLLNLVRYISDTRSAEKMYDDEMKKILFDYKSYIQKITDLLDYNDYKVINVETFKELMGMREELQSPILMYQEKNIRRTIFLMVNQNLLFQFILDSNLIREKLIEISKEKKEKKNEKNK